MLDASPSAAQYDGNVNPYESPATTNQQPLKKVSVLMRGLAVVLWLLAVTPTTWAILSFLAFGLPNEPGVWVGFAVMLGLVCVLPLLGFGLLGLACWRQFWPLAMAGLVVLLSDAVLMAVVAYIVTHR